MLSFISQTGTHSFIRSQKSINLKKIKNPREGEIARM